MSDSNSLSVFTEGFVLALDTGGYQTQVGLLHQGDWKGRLASPDPALESLFPMVRSLLTENRLHFDDLKAFLFCDGPGSILGLRIAASAISGWQRLVRHPLPILHYHSLELLRRHLIEAGADPGGVAFTDFRRQRWLGMRLKHSGAIMEWSHQDLDRIPAEQRYYLPQRRGWGRPTVSHREVAYPFDELPRRILEPGFGVVRHMPELALPGKNDYRRWSASRHRAPQTHE